jgi:hypothetical protein
MPARMTPSARRFVVELPDPSARDELSARVRGRAELEDVEGPRPIAVLTCASGPADPRAAWQDLRKLLGDDLPLHNALTDQDGHERLPTGRIEVRFTTPPADTALAAFAGDHGLRLVARNRYAPAQATFVPEAPARAYLPALVEIVSRSPLVKSAWADVLSAYRRV